LRDRVRTRNDHATRPAQAPLILNDFETNGKRAPGSILQDEAQPAAVPAREDLSGVEQVLL
jgi:hypothetical protein